MKVTYEYVETLVLPWSLIDGPDIRQSLLAFYVISELASRFLILSFFLLRYKVPYLEHLEGRVGCLESLLQARCCLSDSTDFIMGAMRRPAV